MNDKSPKDAGARMSRKSKKTMPQNSVPVPPFHDFIGAKLKSFYAQIANEPVPARFTELLKQLDSQSRNEEEKS
jgi:Anti-sigma factor NepR